MFWDELFVLPFLNFRMSKVSRGLLMYRYRRLDEASVAAREAGFGGAMFPWQSGSEGTEETQRIHLNPLSGAGSPTSAATSATSTPPFFTTFGSTSRSPRTSSSSGTAARR